MTNEMKLEKMKYVLGRAENILGKGENAGNYHSLLFPQCFQIAFFVRVVKILEYY